MTVPAVVACPRCAAPLASRAVGDVALRSCERCDGILVPHGGLLPLLQGLVERMPESFDVDAVPLEPVADKGGTASCPVCAKPMENHGYLETRLVYVDSCRACDVIWLDAGELRMVTLLHARTVRHEAARAADGYSAPTVSAVPPSVREWEHESGAAGFFRSLLDLLFD